MSPTHPAEDVLEPSDEGGIGSRVDAPFRSGMAAEGDGLDAARGIALGCGLGGLCWLLLGELIYGWIG